MHKTEKSDSNVRSIFSFASDQWICTTAKKNKGKAHTIIITDLSFTFLLTAAHVMSNRLRAQTRLRIGYNNSTNDKATNTLTGVSCFSHIDIERYTELNRNKLFLIFFIYFFFFWFWLFEVTDKSC